MPIPDFQALMRPLLLRLQDGKERKFGELVPLVGEDFQLTPEEHEQLLPSGGQSTFRNRLHWAAFYMLRAGLLVRPRRGWLTLTARGREAIATSEKIDSHFLRRYEEFREPDLHAEAARR